MSSSSMRFFGVEYFVRFIAEDFRAFSFVGLFVAVAWDSVDPKDFHENFRQELSQ